MAHVLAADIYLATLRLGCGVRLAISFISSADQVDRSYRIIIVSGSGMRNADGLWNGA